jgi:hypothetical protein
VLAIVLLQRLKYGQKGGRFMTFYIGVDRLFRQLMIRHDMRNHDRAAFGPD